MDANTPETQSFPDGDPTRENPAQGNPEHDRKAHDKQAHDNPAHLSPPQDNPVRANPVAKPVGINANAPARPKGPNASAVVLGLVSLLLAGLIIANETTSWNVDWSGLGPGAIVVIGAVLVVIGAIGLVRRHDDL